MAFDSCQVEWCYSIVVTRISILFGRQMAKNDPATIKLTSAGCCMKWSHTCQDFLCQMKFIYEQYFKAVKIFVVSPCSSAGFLSVAFSQMSFRIPAIPSLAALCRSVTETSYHMSGQTNDGKILIIDVKARNFISFYFFKSMWT